MNRPNIVYIHSHDTGRYIQPYGHAVPTPHLQKLAEEGVLFRQNFCMQPTCSPSRAALLTGQAPHTCGMMGLAHRGWKLYDYKKHLLHTLRAAGYHTALAGAQHIATDPTTIGYDEVLPVENRQSQNAAIEFLKRAHEAPLFLAVGFGLTHRRYPEPGPREDARYCLPPAPLPDTPETRYDMACFKASARMLDEAMGAVFEALDETGLAENTLVICTTDHGIAWPRMKCNLQDSGIGVMLMMRGPGGFTGGKVIDSLVSHVDIFPTVCDLLGIEAPEWLQGVSLMPLVRGEAADVREEVFAEVTYHACYEPMRCVRTKRWKYIRRWGDRRKPILPNCDDSPSKTVWMEAGWIDEPCAEEALYDLVFDPNETNNLAGAERTQAVLADMRARLHLWMEATDDPLLAGYAAPPTGAKVNDPDGISPQEATRTV